MKKMQADSLADLLRMPARFGLKPPGAPYLSPRTGRALHQGAAVDDACAHLPCGYGDILCQR
jgi:hypothetical protein